MYLFVCVINVCNQHLSANPDPFPDINPVPFSEPPDHVWIENTASKKVAFISSHFPELITIPLASKGIQLI